MSAADFFRASPLQLPKQRRQPVDDDFEGYLKGIFDRYLAEFNNLAASDPLSQAIRDQRVQAEELCKGILKAVAAYLHGFPHVAFDEISRAIDRVSHHVELFRSPEVVATGSLLRQLYRIRPVAPNEQPSGVLFRRPDLFHIPFEKRQRVARRRYSIPGLPCLYLGSTLLVCWEELGRLPLHSLYLARFGAVPGEKFTMLDFSRPPLYTARYIEEHYKRAGGIFAPYLLADAILWPLLAACSIRRLHEDAPFIAEYIVSQLLLQWVTRPAAPDRRVDGIVYFSVRAEPVSDSNTALLNFVFPAQKPQSEGHCPVLKTKFELCEPASWELLLNAGLPGDRTMHMDLKIQIVPGTETEYLRTAFGTAESKLVKLPVQRLT
jgi:hypothetical protein